MLLAIDVGNTNIVFALMQDGQTCQTIRMITKERRTADEMGLFLLQCLHQWQVAVEAIADVIISSVVPSVMPSLCQGIETYLQKAPLVVDVDITPSLYFKYDNGGHLAPDRSVCCEAALAAFHTPVIVVDLGTATTVDVVAADGLYLGGCILAGVKTAVDALASGAALLPQIPLQKPHTVLGYDTVEQIQVGSVTGYIGALTHLIEESRREAGFSSEVTIIATGGLAPVIAPHIPSIQIIDDALIFKGLFLLYTQYRSKNHGD